ncbi:MAG: hypothetical protein SGJ10_05030 [Bacteroidota bacterium]|nr:hypothetical protein [Bacteroidota bacterium]
MVVLYPECHTEKFLCEFIGYSKSKIITCNGKPNVINKLRSSDNDIIAIGIVDEVPMKTQHPDCKLYIEKANYLVISLLQQKNNAKYFLIEFKEEFEPWIKNINKKAKVDPERYNSKMDRLHEYTGVNIPDKYKKFLKKIFDSYPDPINKFKQWIKDCDNNS